MEKSIEKMEMEAPYDLSYLNKLLDGPQDGQEEEIDSLSSFDSYMNRGEEMGKTSTFEVNSLCSFDSLGMLPKFKLNKVEFPLQTNEEEKVLSMVTSLDQDFDGYLDSAITSAPDRSALSTAQIISKIGCSRREDTSPPQVKLEAQPFEEQPFPLLEPYPLVKVEGLPRVKVEKQDRLPSSPLPAEDDGTVCLQPSPKKKTTKKKRSYQKKRDLKVYTRTREECVARWLNEKRPKRVWGGRGKLSDCPRAVIAVKRQRINGRFVSKKQQNEISQKKETKAKKKKKKVVKCEQEDDANSIDLVLGCDLDEIESFEEI